PGPLRQSYLRGPDLSAWCGDVRSARARNRAAAAGAHRGQERNPLALRSGPGLVADQQAGAAAPAAEGRRVVRLDPTRWRSIGSPWKTCFCRVARCGLILAL